jgi:hypothetical protein
MFRRNISPSCLETNIKPDKKPPESDGKVHLLSNLVYFSTLKMEETYPSEA